MQDTRYCLHRLLCSGCYSSSAVRSMHPFALPKRPSPPAGAFAIIWAAPSMLPAATAAAMSWADATVGFELLGGW